jgi:hypothetical protein
LDDDDPLALVLGALTNDQGGVEGGPGGDAAEDALPLGQLATEGVGICFCYWDHLIHQIHPQHIGDEPRTNALEIVEAGGLTAEDGAGGGFHRDNFEVGLLLLEVASGPGQGAPVPTPTTSTSS